MARKFKLMKAFINLILCLGLLLVPSIGLSKSTNLLVGIRFGFPETGLSRCVLDFSESDIKFTTTHLEGPERIVIVLKNASWDIKKMEAIPSGHAIKAIKQNVDGSGNVHVVMHLKTNAQLKRSFVLAKGDGGKYRLVLDFTQTPNTTIKVKEKLPVAKKPAAQQKPTIKPAPVQALPTPTVVPVMQLGGQEQDIASEWQQAQKETPKKATTDQKARRPIIVIGDDPGTTSVLGRVQEKDLALTYAFALKKSLEKSKAFDVVLTRTTDKFIPVASRVRRSRLARADLFISLHADAYSDDQMHGISVYTLSEKASDALSEELAKAENKSAVHRGTQLAGQHGDIHDVLVDMVRRDTNKTSVRFAETALQQFAQYKLDTLPNGHREANFLVLKGVDVPAVLIELGFLSNPVEEKMLLSKPYQEKITEAIQKALNQHFGMNS